MTHCLSLSLLVLAMWPGRSPILDGNRQGLVLGLGLGVSPVATWSSATDREHKTGFGYHAVAGWGWDRSNLLVYEDNGTLYHGKRNADSLIGSGALLTGQGFRGAVWYHYYGPTGRSPFTAAGLGAYTFDPGDAYHRDSGAGYLIGAGYEFIAHLQAGLYFSGGRTFQHARMFEPARSLDHDHLSVLVSALAF
jgi:hypothetical protein